MKKETLKKNYKKLKEEAMIIKENNFCAETNNLEKEYPIEVIASTFENRLLADYELLIDFWCFITNENVDISNIQRFIPIIEQEVMSQHPGLKILNFGGSAVTLKDSQMESIKSWYRTHNGEKILIKSLKKGYTKTLELQE